MNGPTVIMSAVLVALILAVSVVGAALILQPKKPDPCAHPTGSQVYSCLEKNMSP